MRNSGNQSLAFATSCDLNYLPQALVLAESIKKIYPKSKFLLGLNERSVELGPAIAKVYNVFDFVFSGTDLDQNFNELDSRYGVIELCCSTKPALLLHASNRKFNQIIYLDPDTYLLEKLDEVHTALESGTTDAVLTPHLTKLGNIEMEISSMKHGVFNLGFLAINNTKKSREFLEWWRTRLEFLSIRDHDRGIFTDQTWAALITGVIPTRILNTPGYNFATWNLGDYPVMRKNGSYFVGGSKLVFLHFSSFAADGISAYLRKNSLKVSDSYMAIYNEYGNKVHDASKKLHPFLTLATRKSLYKNSPVDTRTKIQSMFKGKIVEVLANLSPRTLEYLLRIRDKRRNAKA